MKRVLFILIVSFLFCKSSIGQVSESFVEITIDFSDSVSLNKDYHIQDITTVYMYFEDSEFSFSPLTGENLENLKIIEKKIIDRIQVNNVDTLFIWGLHGDFNCYEFIKKSIKNVSNLFIYSYGQIAFEAEKNQNESDTSINTLSSMIVEGYGINIDLELFNNEVLVEELDIVNGNENLVLKNKSKKIKKVWIESLGLSKFKWRCYKHKFENANVQKGTREFKFRRDSKLNRINLQRESNWKKL